MVREYSWHVPRNCSYPFATFTHLHFSTVDNGGAVTNCNGNGGLSDSTCPASPSANWVETFANDQTVFLTTFKVAYTNMIEFVQAVSSKMGQVNTFGNILNIIIFYIMTVHYYDLGVGKLEGVIIFCGIPMRGHFLVY